MNIRFSKNTVRVRISGEELALVARDRVLKEIFFAVNGWTETLTLIVGFDVSLQNQAGWTLHVPESAIVSLQKALGDQAHKDELAFEATWQTIAIALEVDAFSLPKKLKL